VGEAASKTKRHGQKLPALQAESNFWAPQEGKAGSSPVTLKNEVANTSFIIEKTFYL
jgi:hypothetical protein